MSAVIVDYEGVGFDNLRFSRGEREKKVLKIHFRLKRRIVYCRKEEGVCRPKARTYSAGYQ